MKLGIFISGSGTNMDAIINNFKNNYFSNIEHISFVLSDKRKAAGILKAEKAGIETIILPKKKGESRASYENRLIEAIEPYNVDIIVLAGFLKILTTHFLSSFRGKILNIHPSLLPAFPGLDAQRQAYEYGVQVSGCTIHFVDKSLDGGPIILQEAVVRHPNDSFETFQNRILEKEHILLSKAIEIVSTENYKFNGRYIISGVNHEN